PYSRGWSKTARWRPQPCLERWQCVAFRRPNAAPTTIWKAFRATLLLLFVLIVGIGLIALLAAFGGRRGLQELDVKHQHLIGGHHAFARTTNSVAEIGGDHELPM